MSWVKDRLIELGFADVAARLDRSTVDRERRAAKKKAQAEVERKPPPARKRKGQQS